MSIHSDWKKIFTATDRKRTSAFLCVLWVLLFSAGATAQETALPEAARGQIDAAAQEILAKTGVPSASIAVVKDGRVAYVHAYGDANLEAHTPARSEMRYSVGSISKQFTAAAILLLQEQGKLTLDDKVSRWLPNLTRANEVTVRELLSHTSGYQDYWPQDYVMPMMLEPITAEKILDGWARKPLDFAPGTKWQYSNTNFVIAGLIVSKAAGTPFFQFLQEKIFRPLGMQSVYNIDQAKLPQSDPTGYMRYALGPLHPAPKEGPGWLFAAGELAMTAGDLAKWDISVLDQKLLKPASYRAMETEIRLQDGLGTRYGLGIGVDTQHGRRALGHGGEVSGFTAQNTIFPDDHAAVVVLTNQDAAGASAQIADKIATIILQPPADTARLERARAIFAGLQQGKIDRGLFSSNANAYFSQQALEDFASSLGPLGTPKEFTESSQSLRGGMVFRAYRVVFADKTLRVSTFELPDGKLEQYQVAAAQ